MSLFPNIFYFSDPMMLLIQLPDLKGSLAQRNLLERIVSLFTFTLELREVSIGLIIQMAMGPKGS